MLWLLLVITVLLCHGVSSQEHFVDIDETKPLGTTFGSFTFQCSQSNLEWTVNGVNDSSAFHINATSDNKNISVSLMNYFNQAAFTNVSTKTSDCVNHAYGVTIHVTCNSSKESIMLKVMSFTLKSTSASYFCYSNCSKIESPLTIEIPENTTKDDYVTEKIKLCDGDIVYGNNTNDQSSTAISAQPSDVIDYNVNGLQLKKDIYFKTKETFTTTLKSTREDDVSLKVEINVTDVDDQSIAFTKSLYNCTFQENRNGTIPNCKVKATDLDKGVNTSINYQLISEPPLDEKNSFFVIDETNGSIKVKQNLDREAESIHVLFIKGYQVDRPYDKLNYTTVVINVSDDDDHAPEINQSEISVNVTENIPIGSFVYQVIAADNVDQGENAQFVYELVKQTDNLFELSESTGLITTKNLIDRENVTSTNISLKIKAVSKVKKLASNVSVVHINILDENDNSPVFNPSVASNVSINKTQKLNHCFFTANATDKDIGNNGKVQYSIENNLDTFSISQNGCIALIKSLNESFSSSYALTLKAEDQAEYKRSTTAVLLVEVRDVNIHTPCFVDLPSSINVSEAIPQEAILIELKAKDEDPTDKLTFELNDNNGIFYIHEKTSSLRTKSHLDREDKTEYSLTLVVSDSIHKYTSTVEVHITDENDNSPVFTNTTYEFKVNETTKESPGPIQVGTVEATDSDEGRNGTVTYKIEDSSQWRDNFTVNIKTGEINVTNQLDRDIMGEHDYIQFSVMAFDDGNPSRTGVTLVEIQVIGVNDNIPAYPENDKHVEVYIKEGERKTNLFVSQAIDEDVGPGSIIYYRLAQNYIFFSINNASGVLSVIEPLNISSSNAGIISLNVVAENSDKKQDVQNITVIIQDINNHSPKFAKRLYNLTLSECYSRNQRILRVNATDLDFTKEFNTVYFWIEQMNDTFYVDSTSGEMYLIGDIDYDKPDSNRNFTFEVYATDEATHKTKHDTTTVTVIIQDCNDNPPVFTKGLYQCSVKEESLSFNCIVTATDIDTDTTLTYNISHSDSENFTIDLENGTISVKTSFDYDTMKEHSFRLNVSVSDGMFTSFAEVLIHVENIDDVPPSFSGNSTFEVLENITYPYFIGWINVSDADSPCSVQFTNCSDQFSIHNDGNVFSTSALDYETVKEYTCVLGANDTVNSTNFTVFINILNVNDKTPIFENISYNISVTENENKTLTVKATDEDSETLSYSIDRNIIWGNVSINASTGIISIHNLDRDIMGDNDMIVFSVFAADNGEPSRTGSATVNIRVIGINDNTPQYPSYAMNVTLYVREGTTEANLYTSKAVDHDIGIGSDIRYTIIKDEKEAFEINNATGLVQLTKKLRITSENKGHVEVTVEATNPNSTENNTQILFINILAANNHKPAFQKINYTENVDECTKGNAKLLRVIATDEDSTSEFNTVYYWIEPNTIDTVYIDSLTGWIHFVGGIDYDKSEREINFKVYATDNITEKSNKNHTNVTLNISNCNDNPPIFTQSVYVCNITEGSVGNFGCSVNAVDMDNLTSLQYRIMNQTRYSQNFSIDNETGIISSKSRFDFESLQSNPVFLNVSAYDGNYTSYCEVAVTIINTNDEPPVFQDSSYEFNITENVTHPYYIGVINVTDADSDLVNLELRNCSDQFYIKNTGAIFAHEALDYEKDKDEYVCIVQASDNIHNINKSITINVLDVNDNSPTFNTTYNVTINETSSIKQPFITVNASDNDKSDTNSHLTYSIFAGDVLNKFEINGSTGDISLKESLDTHGGQIFQLTIKATDSGKQPLSGFTTVTIYVLRTNNNPPKFTNSTYHALIYENAGNQTVLQVYADDIDGTDNLVYKVVNDTNDFYFNGSGTLFANNLDAEKYAPSKGDCKMLIRVSDGNYSNDSIVFINIVDENDNFPNFNETDYRKSINDTTAVNSEILMIGAFDEDITNDGFTFIIRNDSGDFEINSTTGQITLLRPLGQNGLQYKMVVEVIDSGNPPKHNTTEVEINVNDTNTAPKFNNAVLNQTVNENDPDVNISLAAIDNDAGQAGNVTYSISCQNNDLEMFHFDTTNARLTLANASFSLNFEEHHFYEFTIIGKDNGIFPKSTPANVTVHVKDINESPYILGDINPTIFVELNTPVDTPIYIVTATDPDVSNANYNTLTYYFEGNETDAHYKIEKNGTVYTKTTIDQHGNYSLTCILKDNGDLTNSTQLTVVVPEIKHMLINMSVEENQMSGNLTLSEDIGTYNVSYEIQPSTHSGKFTIDSNKTLSLTETFDKETTDNTSVRIYGRTTLHGILVANITVYVDIQDVNDCSPEFPMKKYVFTFDDVMAADAIFGRVIAIDRDIDRINRNVSYGLLDNGHKFIRIEETTGELFVGNISSLQPGNISLIASAHDGKFSTNVSIDVIVLDTNDHSPYFNVSKYEFTMVEFNCTDKDCNLGKVQANDTDLNENGEIEYQMIPAEHKSPFEITDTGLIQAVGDIDREENDQWILTVCAVDLGNRPRQCCMPVTINISDINDNAPMFSQANYTARVKENSKKNTTILVVPDIAATDNDKGNNGTEGLKYSLNVTGGPICISQQYPVSVYICGETDRETQDTYYLSVEARDSGNKNASVPFTVYIKDENDETPEFTQLLYTFNITENANPSEYVGNVSVTDRDLDGTANIIYSIKNGEDIPIYINGIQGVLYVGGSIDREKDEQYTLNISAFDGKNFNYTSVDIFVKDVNDNPPQFSIPEREIITINVTENVEYGIIRNISADDKDEKGSNSELVFKVQSDDNLASTSNYSIVCNSSVVSTMNDNCFFEITETGQLNLTRALDRELKDHYSLIVTVSDKGEPPLSSSMTINIHVLDENDNDPTFIVDGKTNVKYAESYMVEKVPENSVLKLIKATDPDFGLNGTFTYSIEDSAFKKYFKIGENSGVVSIAQAISVNTLVNNPPAGEGIFDSNKTAVINLTITATDGGGRKANMTLAVFIEPLNDNDVPTFEEMVFNFKIPENESNGTYVGTCLVNVINETYSHMNYSLISGYKHTRNDFHIDSKTGSITTRIPLDRENIARYTFAVKVRDGRIPERTAFAAVEIEVTDVNDNNPVFPSKDMNVKIPENSSSHEFNVSASDRDLGQNGTILYSLINDFDGKFVIDNMTGILKTPGPFDYEAINHYTVEVLASDSGLPNSLNSSMWVNVSIVDENDNVPQFVDNITSFNVTENSPPHKLFSIKATDKDAAWNGNITYILINKELTPFVIDAFSGAVYLRGQVDYEQRTSYTLTIQAKDQGEKPLHVNKNVNVDILDIYDDVPKFQRDTYEVNIPPSINIVDKSLIEFDVGVTEVEFSISGFDANYFKIIDKNLSLVEELGSDRTLFAITVHAKDRLNQTASCSVIAHTSGHAISFHSEDLPVTIRENLQNESILVDINSTEEMEGHGVVYTIVDVSPPVNDTFTIESDTGVLRCAKPLDREAVARYTISISVRSAVTRRKRDVSVDDMPAVIQIVVTVTDENDNPPKFSESQQQMFGVPDNVRANYIVTTMKANDPDVGSSKNIRYKVTGEASKVFGVHQRTGNIITLVAMASVEKKLWQLTVTAYDVEKTNDKDEIDLFIAVVATEKQPYLSVPVSWTNFNARKDELIKNMSRILGVEIQLEKVEGHQDIGEDRKIPIDLSKTDFYFHGIKTSAGNNVLISNEEMESRLKNKTKELSDLFGGEFKIFAYHESFYDPSAITSTQIILICLAVFIFIGTAAALFFAIYTLRYDHEECKTEAKNEDNRKELEIELSTIRSRQSSKMSTITAAAAVNPAYQETELTDNDIAHNQSNESQEIRVDFRDEFMGNQRFGSRSVIDSGVGNTSVHSHTCESSDTQRDAQTDEPVVNGIDHISQLLATNGSGPVMTSSPRPPRSLSVVESSNPNNEQSFKHPTHSPPGSNIITLDTMDIAETDDDFDEEDDKYNVATTDANIKEKESIKDNGVINVVTNDGNVDLEDQDMNNDENQVNAEDQTTDEDHVYDEDVLESTSF